MDTSGRLVGTKMGNHRAITIVRIFCNAGILLIFPRALDNASRKITQREAFSRSSISDSIERDASCCECDV